MENKGHHASAHGLDAVGLKPGRSFWNLTPAELFEEAIRRGEGKLSAGGAIVTETGQHTGRSPNDRFVVEEADTKGEINWGKVNVPISEAHFDGLLAKMLAHYEGKVASWQIPDKVVFTNDLPLGGTGKVLKNKLRESYGDILLDV